MCNQRKFTCHVICQSHIDLAWLWRWEETIGFIRETFEGEVDLLEKHPDYTFCQSQLAAYMVAQERFPELFEKIRHYVREGRWEIVGGELVESDHLIPGGESLVRQFVYGQLYAREQFGTQAMVGWSPDSFGHSGNLPQILARSGIENFVYKRPLVGEQPVPRTPFWWQGIDGSRVLAYRTTNKGWDFVNPIPLELAARHNLNQIWGYSGTGDRGGVRPYKELGDDEHGRHIYSTPGAYFKAVREEAKSLPTFAGELGYCYEGCYTTHADMKLANRRAEGLLFLAESIASAAHPEGVPYPADEIRQAWMIQAFHQFHDILPGTSIPEVYEDARREYAKLDRSLDAVSRQSCEAFVEQTEGFFSVYNPLPHSRSAYVEIEPRATSAVRDIETGRVYILEDDRRFFARDLSACGFRTFDLVDFGGQPKVSADSVLDNGILRVEIDPETGWIGSITDLRTGREVLSQPGGNLLTLWKEDSFENASAAEWNAWDIGVSEIGEPAALTSGPTRVDENTIRCEHAWGSSTFASYISLHPDAGFADIRLECDWNETLVILRTEFSVDLWTEAEAWHEIPYGAVRREKSGAEVPSWRWVDLSDSLYGAALINDSRCGHSVKDNTLRMTLLRCATNPDPVSDRGHFTFRYRFCPHERTWSEAGIVNLAADLNVPVAAVPGKAVRQPHLPSFDDTQVQLGACKMSEDGRSLVMRLYEPHGRHAQARLDIGDRFVSASEANLLEDEEQQVGISEGALELSFRPFEIKTVLLKLQ